MNGFTTGPVRQQVELTSREVHRWLNPDGEEWGSCFKSNEGYTLRFHNLADFTVDLNGENIICFPTEQIDALTIEHLFLNHVSPLVGGLRGRSVFHGSAIDFGKAAGAFLGKSGSGKSTLALGFAQMGYKFLTDDGITIRLSGQKCLVEPGHPSIRVWDDTFQLVEKHGNPYISQTKINTKKRLTANNSMPHASDAKPLAASYVLGNRVVKDVRIEPVSGSDAAIAWMENSFMMDPTDTKFVSRHFVHVSRIATKSLCFRVDFPRRYDVLPEVCRIIADHIEGFAHENCHE